MIESIGPAPVYSNFGMFGAVETEGIFWEGFVSNRNA